MASRRTRVSGSSLVFILFSYGVEFIPIIIIGMMLQISVLVSIQCTVRICNFNLTRNIDILYIGLRRNSMDLIFDEKSYSRFLNDKRTIYNSRLRDDNETFFDAMLSKEADLRSTPEGERIIQYIQSLGNE